MNKWSSCCHMAISHISQAYWKHKLVQIDLYSLCWMRMFNWMATWFQSLMNSGWNTMQSAALFVINPLIVCMCRLHTWIESLHLYLILQTALLLDDALCKVLYKIVICTLSSGVIWAKLALTNSSSIELVGTKVLNIGYRDRMGVFHIGYPISGEISRIRAHIRRSYQTLYIMKYW